MPRAPRKPKADPEDLEFQGKPPQPDLLDYRHMFIAMEKWAVTDSSCLSLFATIAFAFFCMILICAYIYFVRGV